MKIKINFTNGATLLSKKQLSVVDNNIVITHADGRTTCLADGDTINFNIASEFDFLAGKVCTNDIWQNATLLRGAYYARFLFDYFNRLRAGRVFYAFGRKN